MSASATTWTGVPFEESGTVTRCASNPDQFIDEILKAERSIVVTWGFVPGHEYSVSTASKFQTKGFKLVWFDGGRQAALRIFQTRAKLRSNSQANYYWQMHEFYLQMHRIEVAKIVDVIKPAVVDPFDARGEFKPTLMLLEEMRKS